jgi:hypothetical protein
VLKAEQPAAACEHFFEQLLAAGYAPVTLTLPLVPQEHPAPIQGV